jgi:hypothetical protein
MHSSTPVAGAKPRVAFSLRRLWPLGVLAVGLGGFLRSGSISI